MERCLSDRTQPAMESWTVTTTSRLTQRRNQLLTVRIGVVARSADLKNPAARWL
jgi:hypothetical protein